MLEIASDRAGARTDAALGVFGKPLHVVAGTRGIAFTHGREAEAYSWDEVRSIEVRRRSVRIAVADRSYVFRLVIDDVVEPTLSGVFASILEELRAHKFSRNGTAWHEYQNAIERIEGEFADEDDRIPQFAAAGNSGPHAPAAAACPAIAKELHDAWPVARLQRPDVDLRKVRRARSLICVHP